MNVLTGKVVLKSIYDALSLFKDTRIGYVIYTGNNCTPTAHGAGSLQVDVASGSFIANTGTSATVYGGGSITLAAADATNPRYDIVYFNSAGTLSKTSGTAATVTVGPPPAPVPAVWPAGCCPVAICFVPAAATDFTSGGYVEDVTQYNQLVTTTTFAAPAFTFGTSNAAGAATTAVRTDASIALFNSSVGLLLDPPLRDRWRSPPMWIMSTTPPPQMPRFRVT